MSLSRLIAASGIPIALPAAASYGGVAVAVGPPPVVLSVTVPLQVQSNWCWAATSLGVNSFYNPVTLWTQCSIADTTLGFTNCCSDPTPTACNVPWYLDKALATVGNLDRWTRRVPTSAIYADLVANRPLGARVGWAGGGGHFMVLGGCDVGADTFTVFDPIYGTSTITRVMFETAYQGSGFWTTTYFTQP